MNKTTALVFFAILVLGIVISYFTLGKYIKPVEVTEAPVETGTIEAPPAETTPPESVEKPIAAKPLDSEKPVDPAKEVENPDATPDAATVATPEAATVATPEAVPESAGFASPEAAMQALAGAIGGKDFEAFTKLVGAEAVAAPIRSEVQSLVESPALSLDGEKPFTEISKSATLVRWGLNFVPATGTEEAAPAPM